MTPGPEFAAELADIQGLWRREGRSLDGEPWGEVADVFWAQVGRHFCDVRVPHAGTTSTHVLDAFQSFSGTVTLSHGAIVFDHDIDSLGRDPAHPDRSTLTRRGDVMIERGNGFEERWMLVASPGGSAVFEWRESEGSAATLAGRIVQVGRSMVAVWGGHNAGGIVVCQGFPVRCANRVVHEAVCALDRGAPLPPGWTAPTAREAG